MFQHKWLRTTFDLARVTCRCPAENEVILPPLPDRRLTSTTQYMRTARYEAAITGIAQTVHSIFCTVL